LKLLDGIISPQYDAAINMALFDQPTQNYPKKWKDMSLEYQLMFVYHGSMMGLLMSNGALSTKQEILITAILGGVLTSISIRHRRTMNWHWSGISLKGVLSAGGVLVALGIFLFSASPLLPAGNPRFLPWYLAGGGLGIFGVLSGLRLVHMSRSDFLKECSSPGGPEVSISTIGDAAVDPSWKRKIRGAYSVLFLLVWLDGVASFYYFGQAFRNGSTISTPPQTAPITDHGQTVFVAAGQKALVDSLQTIMFIGIPSILVVGLLLHFVIGVKLFPNIPTLEEWREQKKK
jgi:hypothetical protein